MKLYLLITWGDIEPEIRGPFKTDKGRLRVARFLEKLKERGYTW